MQEWMLSFVDQFGYFGIFFLIFIENVFPPIPSEAVLLFGGALTVSTEMNIPGTIVAATLGSLIGAIVLYALGYIFQAERLKRLFAGKFGKVTHLKPEHVEKAEQWFLRYEGKAVLICRCVPIVPQPYLGARGLCQNEAAQVFAAHRPGQRRVEHRAGVRGGCPGHRLGEGHALL